ncbi:MAG: asparaginase [Thermoanaerobaculia bacterium]|nr:asparaginase [Thermoanaerobaculia bacterium]
MVPVVNVYRGGFLESIHEGSVSVVDEEGRLVASAGNPSFRTFIRSAAKPLQAIPMLEAGGSDAYELSARELALICASHGGENHHVSTAAALLRKGDFDESDLVCGPHLPYDEKSAVELKQSGENPTALHNNCSGNHAGLLLCSELMDEPPEEYAEMGSALQSRVLRTVAEFASLQPEEIERGVDGCGIPAFRMPLARAALAYARLALESRDESRPYHRECKQIFDAMTGAPEYVAGNWSMTTPLIRALGGHVLAKEGAEGFYAMALDEEASARVREHHRLRDGRFLGIAIKIADGSSERSRNPVVLRTLEILGIPPEPSAELDPFLDPAVHNVAGKVVGEVKAEFDLTFL